MAGVIVYEPDDDTDVGGLPWAITFAATIADPRDGEEVGAEWRRHLLHPRRYRHRHRVGLPGLRGFPRPGDRRHRGVVRGPARALVGIRGGGRRLQHRQGRPVGPGLGPGPAPPATAGCPRPGRV
ncbi:hypothetical protein EKG83_19650 [Saccharothrix syringae]|uniref:Uncharacterized protein n=1 Tax=Saccharothrix syringae TaxID=103733 RepID=A0A5Q0H099_SACSY|nr:hypothetical protein EKG83_19650 [Saccharothrix syringae]